MSELAKANGSAPQEFPGVIDTFGTAFSLLNHRPYLIWLPVMLDLLYWMSPSVRVPKSSAVDRASEWPGASLIQWFQGIDLVVIGTLFVPGFVSTYGQDSVAQAFAEPVRISVSGGIVAFVGLIALLVGGLGAAAYLTVLGYLVRVEPIHFSSYVRRSARTFIQLVTYLFIALGLLALLLLPIGVVSTGMPLISLDATPVVSILMTITGLWFVMHFFFCHHAIALASVSPARAIYLSYNVVKQHFRSVVGLLIVYLTIRTGAPVALTPFTDSPWSVPFAIVVHAYLTTGLIVAAMLFFRDRASLLPDNPLDIAKA